MVKLNGSIMRFLVIFLLMWCSVMTVLAQPIISDVSPLSGPVGTVITITGSGFSNSTNGNAVFFGTIQGVIIGTPTSTNIQVVVPLGATYGRILVQSNVSTPAYGLSTLAFDVTDGSTACIMTSASFLPIKNFTAGTTSPKKGIARGDLDGDGKVDLVIIENSSNLVYVLKNTSTIDGNITFTTGLTFTGASTSMTDVAIADIDGDKKPDLVFTNSTSNSITCFRNTSTVGTISFSAALNVTPVAGYQPFALVIGDIDRDGKQDVVIANRANSRVTILRNTSVVGSIGFSTTVTNIACGANPNSITLADINSDGWRDIVTANSGTNTISLIQNNSLVAGTINLGAAVNISAGAGSLPQAVISADLNEDGKPDLIVASKGTNKVSVFENLGITPNISSLSLGPINDVLIASTSAPVDVEIGDMNGDGLPDIIVAGQITGNANALSVLRNTHVTGTSAISFASGVSYSTTTNQVDKLAPGDYNLDGRTDVAVSYTTSIPAAGNFISIFQKDKQLIKPGDAGAITGSTPLCSGQPATFSIDVVSGATNYNWILPTDFSIVSGSNSNTVVTNLGASSGNEQVFVTPVNSCDYGAQSSVAISVQQNPSIISTLPVTRCDSGTVTLTATSDLGTVLWYYQPTGGTSIASGNSFTTEKLNQTTTYYVDAFIGGCTTPTRTPITATINLLPVVKATTSAPANTICVGSTTTTLEATGANSYTWSPSLSLSAGNIAKPTAYPSDTTVYTLVGKDLKGCTNSTTIKINVNQLPNVTASTFQSTICEGASTELRAQGAVNYIWSPALNLNNAAISNPIASPISTSVFTVIGSDQNGCENQVTIGIEVNKKPNVKAFSNITTICVGATVELTAIGALSYVWRQETSLSATEVASPLAKPLNDITYLVIGKDAKNCLNSDSIKINVNQKPILKITPATPEICIGAFTQLQASGALSYVWDPTSELSSTNISNPICTPAATGLTTYSVTGTDVNNCINSTSVTVKVNVLPTIVASTALSTICEGVSSQLNATGAVNYTWSPSATLNTSIGSSPLASPIAGTTVYTVIGTDANNCVNTHFTTITVNARPVVTASATINTICAGTSTTLNASGALSYLWSPAASLAAATMGSTSANPATTTSYTVTGSDGNNCTNTASVSVTVIPIPTITSITSANLCGPGSLNLEAVSTFGSIAWFDSPSGGAPLGSGNTLNTGLISTTKNYYAEASNLGCVLPTRRLVSATIYTVPVVSISTFDDTICVGASTILNASGANAYIWNTSAITANINVSPTITTTYSLSGTDQNLCSNTASIKVVVIPIPSIISTTSGFRCGVGAVTMAAAATNGVIAWYRSPTSTTIRGTGNNFTTTIDIVNTTTYYVEASDFGCTTPTRIPIIATINVPVINPSTLPSGDLGFLYSKSMTVTNLTFPTWSYMGDLPPGVTLDPTTGKLTGVLSQGGNYTFTIVAEQGGCKATQTYTVTINIIKQTTTWNGNSWSNGVPNENKDALITGNYSVFKNGNIVCDNLVVSAGKTLTIDQTSNVTVRGSINNNGVISQHCTALLNLNGTTTGNNIQLIQPKLLPEILDKGKVNNEYIQASAFTTSFGSSALVFDTIGITPPGLSLLPGANKLTGVPTKAGIYTFKIAAIDGTCYVTTPEIKLTITDLLVTSLKFKEHLTVKSWEQSGVKFPIITTSNAPIMYSIRQPETCATINQTTGEVTFQCASPDRGIWIIAKQDKNANYKEAKDSMLLYISKADPKIKLLTNSGILVNKPVLFDFDILNGYDGPVSYTLISEESIAEIHPNGLIEAKGAGQIIVAVSLPATVNYQSFDTTFIFNAYTSKQAPVAYSDTIVLTRNLDGTLNNGTLEPLKNDFGITGSLNARLIDIDMVNAGFQYILFVPTIGTFELDTTTGVLNIRPFVGYSGGKNIEYYVKDTDGLTSSIASILIQVQPYRQDIKVNEIMSPNGDGLNDSFVVGYTDLLQRNELKIYDQVGNSVFMKSNYQNDWMGTDKHGKVLEPGLYYFVFNEYEGEQRALTGFVQIVH